MRGSESIGRKQAHVTIIGCMFLLLSSAAQTRPAAPTGCAVGTVRFDAIIELNAPIVGTHVVLFARYWVAPTFYHVAIVWAEPYVGTINFPVFPITLAISSNKEQFQLSNQLDRRIDAVFAKPLGDRGVFVYRFNNYPLPNIRFAEREAITARLYASDWANAGEPNDGWAVIGLTRDSAKTAAKRNIRRIRALAIVDQTKVVEILDGGGKLLKSITYEYAQANDGRILCKENVLLPATPMTVGFENKGLIVNVDGQEHTIRQFVTAHHAGGRKCTVDYERVRMGAKTLPLPENIDIRRNDTGYALRSARLFNYVRTDLTDEQCREAAERFCHLNDRESKHREFLIKYWFRSPSHVNESDVKTLMELRGEFERIATKATTVGEELRRINMVIAIDLMLGDTDHVLQGFERYLTILRTSQLKQMVLTGGQCMIDTAVRWYQFAAADRLLEQWLDAAMPAHDPTTVLGFAQSRIRHGEYWVIAKLLERSLQSQDLAQARLAAEVLRCSLLYEIHQLFEKADYLKSEGAIAQLAWVASSCGIENLNKVLREALNEAKGTFAKVDNPTPKDKALNAELNRMEQKLVAAGGTSE